jgi:glycine/D-amino acid oxidase-like deaminating enzyme
VSEQAQDVVVVGGGIVGVAAAAFLAEAGASVTLIEREGLASGASGANSGIVHLPFDPVLIELYRDTVELYRALDDAAVGPSLRGEPAGMLFVAEEPEPARRLATWFEETFAWLRPEVLGGASLVELEPVLAPDLFACRVPIGYPIQPAASTYAYADLAERRGARLRTGREARLSLERDRVTGVLVDGVEVPAGAVIVAAGPESARLIDPSGAWAPIYPLWGVFVDTDMPAKPRHVLEEAGIEASFDTATEAGQAGEPESAFSLVPLPVGTAVGSTFLEESPDPEAWVEPLLTRAARFVPSVADAPIRGSHACARPVSIDGRPLIGPVPGREGLYVCSGHGPWGISTGPASARLVADLVLGLAAAVAPEVSPGRFGPIP